MTALADKRCKPCTGDTPALSKAELTAGLGALPGWEPSDDGKAISASFGFANFYETMEFANAIAWIANQEDHHPDLALSYNRCVVLFTTHAVGGLSENDLICAAKVQRLIDQGSR